MQRCHVAQPKEPDVKMPSSPLLEKLEPQPNFLLAYHFGCKGVVTTPKRCQCHVNAGCSWETLDGVGDLEHLPIDDSLIRTADFVEKIQSKLRLCEEDGHQSAVPIQIFNALPFVLRNSWQNFEFHSVPLILFRSMQGVKSVVWNCHIETVALFNCDCLALRCFCKSELFHPCTDESWHVRHPPHTAGLLHHVAEQQRLKAEAKAKTAKVETTGMERKQGGLWRFWWCECGVLFSFFRDCVGSCNLSGLPTRRQVLPTLASLYGPEAVAEAEKSTAVAQVGSLSSLEKVFFEYRRFIRKWEMMWWSWWKIRRQTEDESDEDLADWWQAEWRYSWMVRSFFTIRRDQSLAVKVCHGVMEWQKDITTPGLVSLLMFHDCQDLDKPPSRGAQCLRGLEKPTLVGLESRH